MSASAKAGSARLSWRAGLVVLAVFAFTLVLIGGLLNRPGMAGTPFFDPDEFMRAVRVVILHTTQAWFDPVIPTINPPTGLIQHWTRLLDLFVLVGAWPISLVTDFQTAIQAWSVVLPPLMYAGTLLLFIWLVNGLAGRTAAIFSVPLFLMQTTVMEQFVPGRIDHHGFLIAAFIAILALASRIISRPYSFGLCVAAGAVMALDLWMTVEAVLHSAAVLAAFGLLWYAGRPSAARSAATISISAMIFTFIFLLIERGSAAFSDGYNEIDKISFFYVALFLIASGAFLGAARLETVIPSFRLFTAFLARSSYGIACLAVSVAFVYAFQPQVLHGGINNADPLYLSLRVSHLGELAAAAPRPSQVGAIVFLAQTAKYLLPTMLAIPCLAFLVLFPGRSTRRPWIIFATTFLFLLFLFPVPLKMVPFFNLTAIAVLAATFRRLIPDTAGVSFVHAMMAGLTAAILVTATHTIIPENDARTAAATTAVTDKSQTCYVDPVISYLRSASTHPDTTIMTIPDLGPVILYKTSHSVLSIPNHRKQTGFTATYKTFNASSDGEAFNLITANSVGMILMCQVEELARIEAFDKGESTFAGRLVAGKLPSWLREIDIPETRGTAIHLYAVLP